MPLVSRTFDQLIDFTRTSAATYVDATGKIVPTPASRNLLPFTQEFDNGVWTKGEATVAANSATAPDGTLTADKVVATTAATYHGISRSLTLTAGTAYTFSIYAKASEYSLLRVAEASGGSFYASFNLSTQSVVSGDTGGGLLVSASISNAGNGWFRCSVVFISNSISLAFSGYPAGATVTPYGVTYTGDGTSGIYLWGAQLEAVPDANLVLGSEVVTVNSATLTGATGYTAITGSAVIALAEYLVTYTCTLSAGTIQADVGGTAITSVSTSGTYRAIVTAGTTAAPRFYSSAATGSISNFSVKQITGTTGMPTDYTRNNGGVYPPRFDYDPVTLAPKGLLVEEQRTNLLTYSEQFDNAAWSKVDASITANAAVSPDGTSDADALTENTANAVHTFFQTPNISASTTYTWTVYAKRGLGARDLYLQANLQGGGTGLGAGFAWFDLGAGVAAAPVTLTAPFTGVSSSMTPVGNGWYRCTFTFTTNAANTSVVCYTAIYNGGRVYTGDGTSGIYVWGAQLEAGSFATSYIPTVASQVTRTADVATITGANFSQFYNQSEGTWVAEGLSFGTSAPGIVTARSANNAYMLIRRGTGASAFRIETPSGVQGDFGTLAASGKTAAAYRVDDYAVSTNGGTVSTDTAGALPSATMLEIGALNSQFYLNGHIRSIKYFPTRLSNTQLQALSV